MKKLILVIAALMSLNATAQSGGFNLTESDTYIYDANANPAGPKTNAQIAVDKIKAINGKHIELNLRATMITGTGTEIIPVTKPAQRADEAKRLLRLIKYIKDQGMTVGLRPIFFVVGPAGEFPYFEKQADGTMKLWWHGNIQPSDPNRWFESFRTYLDSYLTVANIGKVDYFTIGAELYSMTVGIEDQWKQYPYGFPGRWLSLLRYVRAKIPKTKLMYDINFTDDSNTESGFAKSGGELERWRYRIVDLANPTDPMENQIWVDLCTFWRELDAIGIDMYRSLASKNQPIPNDQAKLIALLKQRTDSYATQLDTAWTEISLITEVEKKLYFKELGYRSVENGFIDPFLYDNNTGALNILHQTAAYEAFFSSFWDAKWPWFGGVYFWDVSVDPKRVGLGDSGFSPIGKGPTEDVIRKRFH